MESGYYIQAHRILDKVADQFEDLLDLCIVMQQNLLEIAIEKPELPIKLSGLLKPMMSDIEFVISLQE